MWAYQGATQQWYESSPGDYDYIYHFIYDHPELFDGYEPVAHVGLVYVHTAYRNNVADAFNVCTEMTNANIPFKLLVAGDDWWPKYLDETELESLDAVVTTADISYLDAAQQAALDTVSNRTVQWPDTTGLFDLVPREITVDASNVIALPRAKPDDATAPFICHLLNRNYVSSNDTMSVQQDFDVTLADALYGSPIAGATYYEPGETPAALATQSVSGGITVTIPHLEHWGILQLGRDTDGDGLPDGVDPDDDNDGTPDEEDPYPLDTDNDGIVNADDPDDDADGIADGDDDYPLDTDNDGRNNAEDYDDDGDGVSDALEIVAGTDPLDAGDVPDVPLNVAPAAIVLIVLLSKLSLGRMRHASVLGLQRRGDEVFNARPARLVREDKSIAPSARIHRREDVA